MNTHYVEVFQLIMNAFSSPGDIIHVHSSYVIHDHLIDTIASTLLDSEVTYYSDNNAQYTELLLSKEVSIELADYVFIESSYQTLIDHYAKIKKGDFIDPHKSATLIIKTDKIQSIHSYALNGPGIKESTYIDYGMINSFIDFKINHPTEYPLGVDLLIIDNHHNITAIPRTTSIRKV